MAEETKAPQKTAPKQTDEDTPEVVSVDADKSTYKANPDPNPDDVYPAPGPSVIQEPGKP